MATLVKRGSGTPATSGTTWASVTNAVDGTPPANPATYATMTNATASATAYIEVTNYDFSAINSIDTLNSVIANLRHFENNTGRFVSVTLQGYVSGSAVGTAKTCTLATAARDDATVAMGITLTQLKDATFKVRATVVGAASTQSRVFSIDHIDVTADYTPAPPTITQAAYRLYADDTETGSTALAAQDTGYTADVSGGDVNLQIRVREQSTNVTTLPATDDYQLQWEKNSSGTWADVSLTETLLDSYPASNFSAGNFHALNATNTSWVQTIVGNGEKLKRARFYLCKAVTPPNGTVTAVLYALTGAPGTTPTGSAVATSTTVLDPTTLPLSASIDWSVFDFDSTFTLTNGTGYAIGLTTTNTGGNVQWGIDITPAHSGSAYWFSASAWSADISSDNIFEVYTGPATTPTTVLGYASANLTDAAATTNRLTGGSGSFTAGKISETGLVSDLGWSGNNYTELLYSVALKQADLTDTDVVRFRVLRNGATTGVTFTQTPTITIGSASGDKSKDSTPLAITSAIVAAGAVTAVAYPFVLLTQTPRRS